MRKRRREDSPDLPSMGTLVTLLCMGGWAGDLQKPLHQHLYVCDSPAERVHYSLDYYNIYSPSSFPSSAPVMASSGTTGFWNQFSPAEAEESKGWQHWGSLINICP